MDRTSDRGFDLSGKNQAAWPLGMETVTPMDRVFVSDQERIAELTEGMKLCEREWESTQRTLEVVAEDYDRLSEKYRDLWHKQWKVENVMFVSLVLNLLLIVIIVSLS